MTKIIRVLIFAYMSLFLVESFGQMKIMAFKHEKFIELEYKNDTNFIIDVDNIFFRNFDNNCKITSSLNKNFYRIQGDTLKFMNDYIIDCFQGTHEEGVKIRKINIGPDQKFRQAVILSRREIKRIKFIELFYFYGDREFKFTVQVVRKI